MVDFNVRIGKLCGRTEKEEIIRYSKDKVIDNGGRNWVKWILEKEWQEIGEESKYR